MEYVILIVGSISVTALLSSMYLTALANIQEQNFEENLQDEYNSHAK